MKKVLLYTDGGCRGNQKRKNVGAIGGILIHPKTGAEKEYSEAFKNTTNNKMEILAVIRGLELLKEPCEVDIYSDSAYLVNAINQNWLKSWKKNKWTRKGKPLKNVDLWQKLDSLMQKHKTSFHKVKGHANNEYNNIADDLVNDAMDEMEDQL